MKRAIPFLPRILPISLALFCLLAWSVFAQKASNTPAEARTVTIDLVAQEVAFGRQIITVPAGARVIINFINQDRIPHNVSVFESRQARKVIYYGEIINGSQTVQYGFTAPEKPGIYFFRCDLHPRGMIGDFVVE